MPNNKIKKNKLKTKLKLQKFIFMIQLNFFFLIKYKELKIFYVKKQFNLE